MAKHRESIFVVVRRSSDALPSSLCEAYMNLESAEEAAGRMKQLFQDKGVYGYRFEVQPVSYYDE